MNIANRQWFVDQSTPVIEDVPCGDAVVRVRSLDVLERATISARVAKACTVDGQLNTEQFSIDNALETMAASIVDAQGNRIFTSSEDDLAIVKTLRNKVGATVEKVVQALSFPDQEDKLKNLPADPV